MYRKVKDLNDSEIKRAVEYAGSVPEICLVLNVCYNTRSERKVLHERIAQIFPTWTAEANYRAKKVTTVNIENASRCQAKKSLVCKRLNVARNNKRISDFLSN